MKYLTIDFIRNIGYRINETVYSGYTLKQAIKLYRREHNLQRKHLTIIKLF